MFMILLGLCKCTGMNSSHFEDNEDIYLYHTVSQPRKSEVSDNKSYEHDRMTGFKKDFIYKRRKLYPSLDTHKLSRDYSNMSDYDQSFTFFANSSNALLDSPGDFGFTDTSLELSYDEKEYTIDNNMGFSTTTPDDLHFLQPLNYLNITSEGSYVDPFSHNEQNLYSPDFFTPSCGSHNVLLNVNVPFSHDNDSKIDFIEQLQDESIMSAIQFHNVSKEDDDREEFDETKFLEPLWDLNEQINEIDKRLKVLKFRKVKIIKKAKQKKLEIFKNEFENIKDMYDSFIYRLFDNETPNHSAFAFDDHKRIYSRKYYDDLSCECKRSFRKTLISTMDDITLHDILEKSKAKISEFDNSFNK